MPLAVLRNGGPTEMEVEAALWAPVGGVGIYLAGLCVLELRARPDAEW